MLLELLLATTIGILAGTVTGLTPGLHTNTLAVLIISLLPLFSFPIILAATLLLSMSIVHTIIDAIPSIFLGVPDSSMVISALPGHKMLLAGEGYRALQLTALGSLMAVLFAAVCSPIVYLVFVYLYPVMQPYTFWLLISVATFILCKDNRRLIALLFIILSGILGWSTLQITQLSQPLFHLLTGLFGTSLLLLSLRGSEGSLPTQQAAPNKEKSIITMGLLSFIAGTCAALLPGVGSAQVALLAQSVMRKSSDALYLLLTGGINTANMFVSLVTLLALDKARNGSIVALKQLVAVDNYLVVLLFGVMLLSAGAAAFLLIPLAGRFLVLINFVGVHRVTYVLFGALVMLSILFDSWLGLLILAVATFLGIAAQEIGVGKHYFRVLVLRKLHYLHNLL